MHRVLALSASMFLAMAIAGHASDEVLPAADIIFVTSTGFWEESGDPLEVLDLTGEAKADEKAEAPAAKDVEPQKQRGYYKLIAVRQPEGNAHIYLQQIASTSAGPKVITSAELEEFSTMKAYVTDIRPETSDGISTQPGLFATVYLKTDPTATEPETWTVLIDDIGDIKIERETN